MPKNKSSPPRLIVEITPEQDLRLKEIFEYGDRKKIFGVMIDDFIKLFEEFGRVAILMMLERRMSYYSVMEDFALKRNYTSEETQV